MNSTEITPDSESAGASNAAVFTMSTTKEYRNFAWRRWTARWIDFTISGILALVVCGCFISALTSRWESWCESVTSLITMIVLFLGPAIIYAIFGQTLGKKICGIKVCDISGKRISAIGFLKRELQVLIRGEWLCIPLLSLIACSLQYDKVSKGNPASYDKDRVYQARPTRSEAWYDTPLLVFVALLIGISAAVIK